MGTGTMSSFIPPSDLRLNVECWGLLTGTPDRHTDRERSTCIAFGAMRMHGCKSVGYAAIAHPPKQHARQSVFLM